jgi:methyltransferase
LTLAELILALVTLQRAGELVFAQRNTRRLLARGAIELAPRHYPLIVVVHAGWLISLWLLGRHQDVNAIALAAYFGLQVFRFWVFWTLGARWTTRIIVVPGERLVATGPYRLLSHPNYAVVVGEIALLPLVFYLSWIAAIFTILNAMVLAIRIRAENRALAESRQTTLAGTS